MLNVFPIQFLAPLAYTILRLCVALVFLYLAHSHLKNKGVLKESLGFSGFPYGGFVTWYLIVIELVIGCMFFFGFYTQIAALLAMLFSLDLFLGRKKVSHELLPSTMVKILLFFASLSLFITGAGAFAFDLPI